ncbi:CAP domain-containing protein [Egicoccus sp. AB-alg2]|uniref:CAP domain-containing protein n=1 Tax=Egicoccus sp. AB-alg2 TaxID=3242693 RepID=UPI00359D69D1
MLRRTVTALMAVLLLAGATSVPANATTVACTETAARMERLALELINETRAAGGVAPVAPLEGLHDVARTWSRNMASTGTFAHNPSYFGQYPAGATSGSENIAYRYPERGLDSVRALHQQLVDSPGHHANIMRATSTHVGLGFACAPAAYGSAIYLTQNFATYPSTTSPATHPAPAPPASLTGKVAGPGAVRLAWPHPTTPTTSLRVQVNGTTVAKLPPETTTHTLTGLPTGTTATFGVRAVNQAGTSKAVTVEVRPIDRPARPGGASATALGSGRVEVRFTPAASTTAAPVKGYRVKCVAGCASTATLATVKTSPAVVTGLPRGKTVTLRVMAYNAAGRSAGRDVSLTVR